MYKKTTRFQQQADLHNSRHCHEPDNPRQACYERLFTLIAQSEFIRFYNGVFLRLLPLISLDPKLVKTVSNIKKWLTQPEIEEIPLGLAKQIRKSRRESLIAFLTNSADILNVSNRRAAYVFTLHEDMIYYSSEQYNLKIFELLGDTTPDTALNNIYAETRNKMKEIINN